MEIDRQLRKDIASAVESAVRDTLAKMEERWLTGKQVCEHFAIAKEWLEEYGDTLPREPYVVETLDGKKHVSNYKYPMHKINQMIADGKMRKLKSMKIRKAAGEPQRTSK